jgi:hypothetical protein
MSNSVHLKDIFGIHLVLLAIGSNMLSFDIALHGLAHVVSVLAIGGGIANVVGVVALDHAEDAVAQLLVEVDGSRVALSNEQVHEERVAIIGRVLKLQGQDLADAEASILRRDGKSGDMTVPRKKVLGVSKVLWATLKLSHDYKDNHD